MFNDVKIGPITVHMYGLMIAVGFACALKMCLVRGKNKGLDSDRIWGLWYCALIFGLLGAKLLYAIVSYRDIVKKPSEILNPASGFVVYGGILGGVIACLLYARIKQIRFFDYFDLAMPAVSMAQGFGRLGCFFAGCCYGKETKMAIGIVFKHSDFAPNGVSLLPVQLFSSAGNFVICMILLHYDNKKHDSGMVGALWMILYGIGRYLIEFIRADKRGYIGPLTTSQAISIAILYIGLCLWLKKHENTKSKKDS